jgi:hypothetical protein
MAYGRDDFPRCICTISVDNFVVNSLQMRRHAAPNRECDETMTNWARKNLMKSTTCTTNSGGQKGFYKFVNNCFKLWSSWVTAPVTESAQNRMVCDV